MALSPWVRTVAYCELDIYPRCVLLDRMADGALDMAGVWDDVKTLTRGHVLEDIDIIAGGFPCQDISIAGNGAGIQGERSGLFKEIIRLCDEFRPSFVFLENVPAITFRGLELVLGDLSSRGYDCIWNMLRASDLGAQHARERWFALAYSDSARLQVTGHSEDTKSERGPTPGRPIVGSVQGNIWGEPNAELYREFDGISPKTHRIKSLGNAVLPVQAREAFKRLMGLGDSF